MYCLSQMIRIDYCKDSPDAAVRSLLRYLPLSLAVREAIRMRALADYIQLQTPVMDVGCGDGLFWEVVTKQYLASDEPMLEGLLGIDISKHELKLASVRLAEKGCELKAIDIASGQEVHGLGELQGKFRTVIANCSLEHIPNLDVALSNIRSFLKPGEGDFFLFVPAPDWTDSLFIKRLLSKFSNRLAGMYGGFFDGFFQHHHLYPAYVWKHLLEGNGFKDVEIRGVGSKTANHLFELWLPPAFVSFLFKAVLKRYPSALNSVKMTYIKRFSDFIPQIRDGATTTSDLTNPHIIEYFIHCRS